jgi:hypothetical protein
MPGRNFKSASITMAGRPTSGPTDRHPRFLLFKLTRAPTGEWERILMTVCFVGVAPSWRFARHKSGLKIAQIVAESAAACLLCSSVTEPFAHKRVIFILLLVFFHNKMCLFRVECGRTSEISTETVICYKKTDSI